MYLYAWPSEVGYIHCSIRTLQAGVRRCQLCVTCNRQPNASLACPNILQLVLMVMLWCCDLSRRRCLRSPYLACKVMLHDLECITRRHNILSIYIDEPAGGYALTSQDHNQQGKYGVCKAQLSPAGSCKNHSNTVRSPTPSQCIHRH